MAENQFLKNFNNAFKKEALIQTSDDWYLTRRRYWSERNFELTADEIEEIINNGDINQQITLSRQFYKRGGFYRNIINYYATLLKYMYLLIPNPAAGKKISDKLP